MKKFFTFRRRNTANLAGNYDRARFVRSMPGETGALASVRYSGISV